MKIYKKSDLTMTDGMIVTKDNLEIVCVDPEIVSQANALDTLFQKTEYLAAQPDDSPMPSLDGFVRKSINDVYSGKFKAVTPILDKRADEAMALMDELDDVAVANRANEMMDKFIALLKFVKTDYVIDHGTDGCYQFDTPAIGSVLDLTEDDVVNAVAFACGLAEDDEE